MNEQSPCTAHAEHSSVGKHLSRRRFLKLALASGSLVGLAVVSCGPSGPAPTTAPTQPAAGVPTPTPFALTTPTAAAQPTRPPTQAPATVAPTVAPTTAATTVTGPVAGGKVIATSRNDFTTLDPAQAVDYETWSMLVNVYTGLYNIDKNMQIVPDLADGMPEISNGGITYVIKLKKGVKFHHGREMTADDVIYTFNRTANPKTKSWGQSYLAGILGYDEVADGKAETLKGLKKIDPYTIEITLKAPRAVFMQELTMSTIHIVPKEKVEELGDKFSQQAFGTGAFKIKEWIPGQRLVMVKNPDYYEKPYPYLDEVEYQFGVEPNVSLLRVLRGEIDFSVDPPPATELAAIINDPKYKDYRIVQPDVYSNALGINVMIKPFDKLEVRQAVAYALNVDKYVSSLGGAAVRMNGWIPAGIPGFNPDLKPHPYDPAKAKELLASAGLANGFQTEIYWRTGRSDQDAIYPMIQQDLKQIGIDAKANRVEAKALQQASRKMPGVPLQPYTWGPDFPDPFDWYIVNFRCENVKEGGTNTTRWCDSKWDEMMDQAEKTLYKPEDKDKRLKVYQDLEKQILDNAVIVPLYQLNLIRLRSPRFKGYYMHPIWREDWTHYWTLPK